MMMQQNQTTSPYNRNNTRITLKVISSFLHKYGIDVKLGNLSLYQQAFTTDSYIKESYPDITEPPPDGVVELQDECNERMEMLGDTFIKCIITEYIYERYYYADEGFLTSLKTRLEDTKSLSKYARSMGLGTYMLISTQIEHNNGRDSEKLLEDTFEAFTAALQMDQGYDVVRKFIRAIMEVEVDFASILEEDINYMKRLQEFYHTNKWSHPRYEEIQQEKIFGKNYYKIGVCDFLGEVIEETINTAQTKKLAKQEAAKLALIFFQQYD